MSAVECERTVRRWQMRDGELRYVGRCPAPLPRVAVEEVLDPPEQLHREPTVIGAGGSREP